MWPLDGANRVSGLLQRVGVQAAPAQPPRVDLEAIGVIVKSHAGTSSSRSATTTLAPAARIDLGLLAVGVRSMATM